MFNEIKTHIEENIRTKEALINLCAKDIEMMAKKIIDAYKNNGKIIVMGNGGSAADAQHFVAELSGRFLKEREPLPAVCLNTNVSTMTAIANDYGYSEVFARQIDAIAEPNDVVIGISTSGNSKNINEALQRAINSHCVTIGLIGNDGGLMKNLCDFDIVVPSKSTPRIQEAHILIIHIICDLVEKELFPEV